MKLLFIIISFLVGITPLLAKEEVTFSKCVDGDTIKVLQDDKVITVRLLAVDTPESVKSGSAIEYYGIEASKFTCDKITNAKKIELEYDDNSDRTDKYGRLLAWVFVDDYLLQELLVQDGYAEVAYLYGDYKYTSLLQDRQAVAEAMKKGIWDLDKKEKWISKQESDDEDYNDLTIKEILVIIAILILGYFYKNMVKKLNKYKKKVLKK